MKILVIGGNGHVGSFLVPQLLKNGHEVWIGGRYGKPIPEDSASYGAKSVVCTTSDEESLRAMAKEGFDVVMDFHGTRSVPRGRTVPCPVCHLQFVF